MIQMEISEFYDDKITVMFPLLQSNEWTVEIFDD